MSVYNTRRHMELTSRRRGTEKIIAISGLAITSLVCILSIAFIALKLAGIIDWSWVWVLSPLWISFILTTVLTLCLSIVIIIILLATQFLRR